MQLNANGFIRGVRCDLTGEELYDHFTYYSVTGQQYYINSSKQVITPGPKGALDLDISQKAFDTLWGRVRDNLGNPKSGAIKCDLSPKYMTGEFKYWKVEIVRVDVDIKEVETNDKMEASVVSTEHWDFVASDEEIQKFIALQKEHCSKPFDDTKAPKIAHKKQVIKIPAPITPPEEKENKPGLERYKDFSDLSNPEIPEVHHGMYSDELAEDNVSIKPTEQPKPKIEPHEVDHDFFRKRAEDIIKQSRIKKTPPASPITPDVELEPEITKKKVQLPDVGARTNIKRRKNK